MRPAAMRSPAGKYKGVNLIPLDYGEVQIAAKRSGPNGLPIAHRALLNVLAAVRVAVCQRNRVEAAAGGVRKNPTGNNGPGRSAYT